LNLQNEIEIGRLVLSEIADMATIVDLTLSNDDEPTAAQPVPTALPLVSAVIAQHVPLDIPHATPAPQPAPRSSPPETTASGDALGRKHGKHVLDRGDSEDEDEDADSPPRPCKRTARAALAPVAGAASSTPATPTFPAQSRALVGVRPAQSRPAPTSAPRRCARTEPALKLFKEGSQTTWRGYLLKVLHAATEIENRYCAPSGRARHGGTAGGGSKGAERDDERLAKLWVIVNVYAGLAIGWLRARPKLRARSNIIHCIDNDVVHTSTTSAAGAQHVREAVKRILRKWPPTSWRTALVEAHHLSVNTYGGSSAFHALVEQALAAKDRLSASDAESIRQVYQANASGPSKAVIKRLLAEHSCEHLLEDNDDGLDDVADGGEASERGEASEGKDAESARGEDDDSSEGGGGKDGDDDGTETSSSADEEEAALAAAPDAAWWVPQMSARVNQTGSARASILLMFHKHSALLPATGVRVGPRCSSSVLHACARTNVASLLELLLLVQAARTDGNSAAHAGLVSDLLDVAVEYGAVDVIMHLLVKAGGAIDDAQRCAFQAACTPAAGVAATAAQERSLCALATWARMCSPNAPMPSSCPPPPLADLSRGLEPVPIAWHPDAQDALRDFLYVTEPLVLSAGLEAIAAYGQAATRPRASRDSHADWLVRVRLQVRLRGQSELGVFALQDIQKDAFICVFAGELKLASETDETDDDPYVIRTHGSRTLVDASRYGNVSRFIISDSSRPNVSAQDTIGGHGAGYALDDGSSITKVHWVEFIAKRLIKAGEELGFRRL
jgi:hypothetical protein